MSAKKISPERNLTKMIRIAKQKKKPSYRLNEAAKILGFSERQIYRMVSEYEPTNKRTLDSFYTRGGQHVILFTELADYVARNNAYLNEGICN